jgi:lysophospholipase L1-like esterase
VIARRPRTLGWLLLLLIALTGCSSGGSTHEATASTSARHTLVVGLGDSVPAAAGCTCTSFVTIYGDDVQRHTGSPNQTDNFAKNGLDTAGLMRQLGDKSVADAVSHADLLTLTIGANDFSSAHDEYAAGTCGAPDGLDCVQDTFPILRSNLTSILQKIRALAGKHPLGVRVNNYWNVFEAGEVARDKYGEDFSRQSDQLTQEVNAIICDVAVKAGDTCIDLYSAFKRATPTGDPTALLAPDGDHPNQAGHNLIAETITAAGFAPLP